MDWREVDDCRHLSKTFNRFTVSKGEKLICNTVKPTRMHMVQVYL